MGRQISEKVTWVGKIDWRLTSFHGNELSTARGSSYNSYLVRDRKTVLIDTVWQPFDKEFVARLREEIDLADIDAIVMNHNEIDHSGALPELMRAIPTVPIYCTAKGEGIIRGHYNEAAADWNFVNVKTGDTLDIGESTLTFIEAPMLHWPDTMFTYLSGEGILFSNDGFGQHYATESLFDDENDLEMILAEAEKYYANILAIYSKQVRGKLAEVLDMGLTLDMVAPSHGVIWRDHIAQIVERYQTWSQDYAQNQITIVYDTMWNSTRMMADALAQGIRSADEKVTVKVFNVAEKDKNDVLTEVFRSKAILAGSPTVNYGFTYAMGGMLELIEGAHLRGKKAAAFGSYGWSGNVKAKIASRLEEAGFEIVDEGIQELWVPDQAQIEEVRAYGAAFARKVAGEADGEREQGEVEAAPPAPKYACKICGFVYDPAKGDPDSGIAPGTPFEDIPDDWSCPICGVGKENFELLE